MEDSYLLLSFKEFIARAVANDFNSPELCDWDSAEIILEGLPNFVQRPTIDKTLYKEISFLEQYELFMENPEYWIQNNEISSFKESDLLIDNLINDYITN
jgi:hypothetical protein